MPYRRGYGRTRARESVGVDVKDQCRMRMRGGRFMHYLFDDYTLDTARRELLHAAGVIPLEPPKLTRCSSI